MYQSKVRPLFTAMSRWVQTPLFDVPAIWKMNNYISTLTAQVQVANGLQHAMLPGSASLGSPASTFHGYRRLPNTDDVSLEQWLVLCQVAGLRAYQCTWPACLSEPFKRKHEARNHLRKHLGITKVFECITWYAGELVDYVWHCVDASWKWYNVRLPGKRKEAPGYPN